jgi:hypothetical protein
MIIFMNGPDFRTHLALHCSPHRALELGLLLSLVRTETQTKLFIMRFVGIFYLNVNDMLTTTSISH